MISGIVSCQTSRLSRLTQVLCQKMLNVKFHYLPFTTSQHQVFVSQFEVFLTLTESSENTSIEVSINIKIKQFTRIWSWQIGCWCCSHCLLWEFHSDCQSTEMLLMVDLELWMKWYQCYHNLGPHRLQQKKNVFITSHIEKIKCLRFKLHVLHHKIIQLILTLSCFVVIKL